ncbi:hypothetical protein VTO73DRAFT_11374 [Trametes versicolor]
MVETLVCAGTQCVLSKYPALDASRSVRSAHPQPDFAHNPSPRQSNPPSHRLPCSTAAIKISFEPRKPANLRLTMVHSGLLRLPLASTGGSSEAVTDAALLAARDVRNDENPFWKRSGPSLVASCASPSCA